MLASKREGLSFLKTGNGTFTPPTTKEEKETSCHVAIQYLKGNILVFSAAQVEPMRWMQKNQAAHSEHRDHGRYRHVKHGFLTFCSSLFYLHALCGNQWRPEDRCCSALLCRQQQMVCYTLIYGCVAGGNYFLRAFLLMNN